MRENISSFFNDTATTEIYTIIQLYRKVEAIPTR